MTTILLGIDGTGAFLDRAYYREMNGSFVAYILRHSKAKLKMYIRGPWAEGLDMVALVKTGHTFVHLGLAANRGARILLTGYSRGGSGVIGIAQRLKAENVKVHGMILFDAVDRAVGVDTAVIPSNVERVVYARRDPKGMSRLSFGNTGTSWRAPTKVEMRSFLGTHGAIGGCQWKCPPDKQPTDLIEEPFERDGTKVSYQQDLAAAQAVWTWVKPRVSALGYFENSQAKAYV